MRQEHQEDEVQEILKRAMHIDSEKKSRQDALRMSAAELGISEEALAQAEVQYLREKAERDELEAFKAHRRRGIWEHVISYVVVNGFLVAINLLNWNGHFWAAYPLLGWGLGLVLSSVGSFNPNSEDFQKDFAKWKQKRDRRHRSDDDDDDEDVVRFGGDNLRMEVRRRRRDDDDDDDD